MRARGQQEVLLLQALLQPLRITRSPLEPCGAYPRHFHATEQREGTRIRQQRAHPGHLTDSDYASHAPDTGLFPID